MRTFGGDRYNMIRKFFEESDSGNIELSISLML